MRQPVAAGIRVRREFGGFVHGTVPRRVILRRVFAGNGEPLDITSVTARARTTHHGRTARTLSTRCLLPPTARIFVVAEHISSRAQSLLGSQQPLGRNRRAPDARTRSSIALIDLRRLSLSAGLGRPRSRPTLAPHVAALEARAWGARPGAASHSRRTPHRFFRRVVDRAQSLMSDEHSESNKGRIRTPPQTRHLATSGRNHLPPDASVSRPAARLEVWLSVNHRRSVREGSRQRVHRCRHLFHFSWGLAATCPPVPLRKGPIVPAPMCTAATRH